MKFNFILKTTIYRRIEAVYTTSRYTLIYDMRLLYDIENLSREWRTNLFCYLFFNFELFKHPLFSSPFLFPSDGYLLPPSSLPLSYTYTSLHIDRHTDTLTGRLPHRPSQTASQTERDRESQSQRDTHSYTTAQGQTLTYRETQTHNYILKPTFSNRQTDSEVNIHANRHCQSQSLRQTYRHTQRLRPTHRHTLTPDLTRPGRHTDNQSINQ